MSKAKKYFVGEAEINPVVLGTELFTGQMSEGSETGTFVVSFYDVSGNPVAPTTGAVEHYAEVAKGQYMDAGSGDIPIDATKCLVAPAKSTYVVPVYNGHINRGVMKLVGLSANCVQYSAYFWRV